MVNKIFNLILGHILNLGGIKYNLNERRPYSNTKNKDSIVNRMDSGFNKKTSISKNIYYTHVN